MSHRFGKHSLITFLVLLTVSVLLKSKASSEEQKSQPSLLGKGRGLDHVMIVVRDLDDSEKMWREKLGFKIQRSGKFPDGIENRGMVFKNRTYLELLGIYDTRKAAQTDEATFLQKHQGATGLALHVSSAQQTASFLKSKGFDVNDPASMEYTPEGAEKETGKVRIVSFKKPIVPGGVFFIQYEMARQRNQDNLLLHKLTEHPNTAEKIESVWIAVKDLDGTVKGYESIGLTSGRKVDFPKLGAEGREIRAGEGVLLLLRAKDPKGEVALFLTRRGEGIIGVSIKVARLQKTRAMLEADMGQRITPYEGSYGKSILVPVELTQGVWLELFQ